MNNYYEILEISENASPEVIERVYKLLAKKHHPDLNPNNQKEAEEKFKLITAAYDVLSNPEKRKEYDEELKASRAVTQSTYTSSQPYYGDDSNMTTAQKQAVEQANLEYEKNKAYNDAYYNALKRMGVQPKTKDSPRETWNKIRSIGLTIFFVFILFVILLNIPYTRQKMNNIYYNNGPIRMIVDFLTGGANK